MDKDRKDTHYVYSHTDPRNNEIVYIGHGWKSRAWTNGSYGTVLRSKDHVDWLEEINNEGYLPCDFVHILHRGLSKSEACQKEQDLIREIKPRFNKPLGLGNLKVNKDNFILMNNLRAKGVSYQKIAEEVGLSTMTVYRAINGGTKNVSF